MSVQREALQDYQDAIKAAKDELRSTLQRALSEFKAEDETSRAQITAAYQSAPIVSADQARSRSVLPPAAVSKTSSPLSQPGRSATTTALGASGGASIENRLKVWDRNPSGGVLRLENDGTEVLVPGSSAFLVSAAGGVCELHIRNVENKADSEAILDPRNISRVTLSSYRLENSQRERYFVRLKIESFSPIILIDDLSSGQRHSAPATYIHSSNSDGAQAIKSWLEQFVDAARSYPGDGKLAAEKDFARPSAWRRAGFPSPAC